MTPTPFSRFCLPSLGWPCAPAVGTLGIAAVLFGTLKAVRSRIKVHDSRYTHPLVSSEPCMFRLSVNHMGAPDSTFTHSTSQEISLTHISHGCRAGLWFSEIRSPGKKLEADLPCLQTSPLPTSSSLKALPYPSLSLGDQGAPARPCPRGGSRLPYCSFST